MMVAPTMSFRETNPLIKRGGNGCLRGGRLVLLAVKGKFSWLLKRNADLLALAVSLGQKRYVLNHILALSPSLFLSVSKAR